MTSCFDTIQDYGLRAIGIGERLLPKSDITLCEQFVLIGSGAFVEYFLDLLHCYWVLAGYGAGTWEKQPFNLVTVRVKLVCILFRGSPLFIQFFSLMSLCVTAESWC